VASSSRLLVAENAPQDFPWSICSPVNAEQQELMPHPPLLTLAAVAAAALLTNAATTSTAVAASPCLGEFSVCPSTGECTMSSGTCGRCKKGQYLCPSDQRTCVASAEAYTTCPGMRGTHLDWQLTEQARLDYLVRNTTLEEKVSQMTNSAPSLDRLGIPAYNWLNDDQHGVGRTDGMMPGAVHQTAPKATILPNGCGLGATWSKRTLAEAGRVLGREARGLHNGFVHMPGGHEQSMACNGCGITLYSPNLNLVGVSLLK
jgi:hypothetical protein